MKATTFVLLAAAAAVVVLVVYALREPAPSSVPAASPPPLPSRAVDESPPPVADIEPVAEPEPEGVAEALPEIVSGAELNALLQQYGIGRLEGQWREWAMSRGFPVPAGSDGYAYEQPYDQYDDETLRGLADNGDMWAQQMLAKRISRTNPAEAIELYREAAIRGSVYAMSEMANLFARISDKRREVEFKSQDLALEQVYAMRDAPVSPEVSGYAWTAVAAMAGTEPMFGNIAATQLSRQLSDEQKDEACSIASGMYDEIRQRRQALGLGDYDRSPPPIVYWDQAATEVCPGQAPSLDLSGCREMQIEEDGDNSSVWLCGDE